MVKAEDGDAVDGKQEDTACDDGVKDGFEGVEVGGMVARGRGLDRKFENDKRAGDEVAFPNTAFFNTTGLDGGRGGAVTL